MIKTIYTWCLNCEVLNTTGPIDRRRCVRCLRATCDRTCNLIHEPDGFKEVVK